MILKPFSFAITASFVRTFPNSFNRQRDQDQIQDSAMVGTNCRLQNS
jgi:hypothetical protein